MKFNNYKKAILRINLDCNNNCIFCHSKRNDITNTFNQLVLKIKLAKEKNIDLLLLSGGEPTISPDFFKLISEIKKEELNFGVITNGRMLTNNAFFEKLLNEDPKEFHISLHGSNELIHDKITQTKNSFIQTIASIKKITDLNLPIIINLVINNENLDDVENIINLCIKLKVKKIRLSYVVPVGKAKDNIRQITPPLLKTSTIINGILSKNKQKGVEIKLEYFPLCFLKDHTNRQYDLKDDNIMFICNLDDSTFLIPDTGEQKKQALCKTCLIKDFCKGNYTTYISLFGEEKTITPTLK